MGLSSDCVSIDSMPESSPPPPATAVAADDAETGAVTRATVDTTAGVRAHVETVERSVCFDDIKAVDNDVIAVAVVVVLSALAIGMLVFTQSVLSAAKRCCAATSSLDWPGVIHTSGEKMSSGGIGGTCFKSKSECKSSTWLVAGIRDSTSESTTRHDNSRLCCCCG